MKKILFVLLVVCLSCGNLLAQDKLNIPKFELQENGLFLSGGKPYIVIEMPGQTKAELYKQILVNVSYCYKSPNDVISSIENEVISINGYEDTFWGMKTLGQWIYLDAKYVIKIHFKDGKVRVDSPIVSDIGPYNNDFEGRIKFDKVFKKDGSINPKRQRNVDESNNYFNNLIERFFNTPVSNEEDW
ncbi:MAG: DUF4468 domain-containing protein [Bacteroidaceae bacterium]|nr:DUF4468 domain-containing protein [Bacteroidaceae bacterium]